jgi:hypothetical protein
VLSHAAPQIVAGPRDRVSVTDVVLQNWAADRGLITISNGATTLLTMHLEDFRMYDLHFLTPIVVPSGGTLTMKVACANKKGTPDCQPHVLVDGTMTSTR